MDVSEEPLIEAAKRENQYGFADAFRRVEATAAEFNYAPGVYSNPMFGSFAAQMVDAFEAGYSAAVFDIVMVKKQMEP